MVQKIPPLVGEKCRNVRKMFVFVITFASISNLPIIRFESEK